MIFSFSKIKTIHDCPLKYKKYYIDKLRLPSGEPAIFGQAIHKLFKDIVEKNIERPKAIGMWKSYFINETVGNDESITVLPKNNFWMTKGYPVINVFYKHLPEFKIKKIISLEKRYEAKYGEHDVVLVTDMIYEDTDGKIVLADYKTGKEKELDYYQLQFYKDRVGVKIDTCKLYYTFKGITEFEVDKYKEETEKYIDDGLKILTSGNFFKNVKKECKYCYFYKNKTCDAKKGEEGEDVNQKEI